jgi:hypothetical protein
MSKNLATPDVTPVQMGAGVTALGAVLAVIYQAPERLQVPILALVALLGSAWLVSDAIIRHGRAAALHVTRDPGQ